MSASVLQVIAGAKIGGAEAFFTRLVTALAKAGTVQEAVIRKNAERRTAFEEIGLPVTELTFGGKFDLFTKKDLKKRAKAFDPDVVMVWMNRAARIAPKGDWAVVGRLGGYYKLKNYQRCDHLVANTEDIRDYLIAEGWPKERSWYLPNFVDDRKMKPVDRADFDTPADAPLLLCLGRLHTNKGFDTAIEMMERLPNSYLWIAGEGKEEAALKAQATRRGVAARVRFLGWRNDASALLGAADIFICSSRHEPLGNIVLEAWAHGVPVVAAASQGPTQLIEDAKTGLLVPVDDAKALAKAVKKFIQSKDLQAEVTSNAESVYAEKYSQKTVVTAYQEFFEIVRRQRA